MSQVYYVVLFIYLSFQFVSSRLIYPPFFQEEYEDHFNHQRVKRNEHSTKSRSSKHCSEDQLMSFLAEIQVINPESILKIATTEDLNRMCRQVGDNLDKTEKYLSTCDPPSQPDLYLELIKGVQSLHQKLCNNVEFQKKFETYHHCLKEMSSEFESCNGPADWNEDSQPAKICAAYKETVDCYYVKAAKVCGKEAAETMKELMEAIINSIITVKCDLGGAPSVPDAMPKAYIEKTQNKKMKKPSTAAKQVTTPVAVITLELIIYSFMYI